MLSSKMLKSSGFVLGGFLFGAAFMLATGFGKHNDNDERIVLEPGVFGDIKIVIAEVDHLEAKEALTIYKDEYPFIIIYKNSSGRVDRWAISNGFEGLLALSMFDKGRISEFGIFGNKVHDDKKMPVFTLDASDKPGIWHEVKYIPSSKVYKEGGQIKSYKPIGEAYEDLDFDGQFDAKSVWDENSEITSQSIFINGKWQKLGWRSPDGEMRKVGAYNIEKLEAYTRIGKGKVYYDFEFGKGWKRRVEAK